MPPDPTTALRLALLANGYVPIPVTSPDYQHPKLKSPGKAPFFAGWQTISRVTLDEDAVRGWPSKIRNHPSTGLLTGDMVGLDLDVPVPALATRLERMADALLGVTPLQRIGKAPKSLRCYRAAVPMTKAETPELILDDGTVVQVEAMGTGQQVVAYGTHPATGQPYRWIGVGPDTVPLADLPVVTEQALQEFLAAAEAVLRQAGGLTKQEREKATADTATAEAARQPKPGPAAAAAKGKGTRKAGDGEFFRQVNKAALGNIGAWLPVIFPSAEKQKGGLTSGAWRVSSEALGRSLEEDLSMHPTEGGQDFGTRQGCSPIDVVIEWHHAPDPKAAALWLCEQLRIVPADLGWSGGKSARERPKAEARAASNLPLIQVTAGDLHKITTAAEAAIIAAGEPIYQRGPDLVVPIVRAVSASHGRTTMAAWLSVLAVPGLVDVLCSVADWERFDARADAFVRTNPPRQVAEILLSRHGRWNVPDIVGVVTTPTMRADGSILDAHGYDPATRLFHIADPALKLHPAVNKPTRADAEKALVLLSELLAEFPFVGKAEPDSPAHSTVAGAVALSALITPVVRAAVPVAPAHAFRANAPGSGKSYLADTSSAIATGRPCPVTSAAPGDEGETEKRLTGLLLAGSPIISLDNVNGELGGDLLCQAIERPLIQVRPLGRSEIVEIESRATIIVTGNGLRVRGDMVRRTLVSDLDAGMERPEERQFTGDPVGTIMADRGRYVSACLIIVRAYLLAGSPGKLPTIASFEAWSGLVRSALVWMGCCDPVESMKVARDDDPELADLGEMLGQWHACFGPAPVSARDVLDAATKCSVSKTGKPAVLVYPDLNDVLFRIAGGKDGISTKRLGRWLMEREGRVVADQRFKRAGNGHGGVVLWRAEKLAAR
jgi:putative DNA primase/helicase